MKSTLIWEVLEFIIELILSGLDSDTAMDEAASTYNLSKSEVKQIMNRD